MKIPTPLFRLRNIDRMLQPIRNQRNFWGGVAPNAERCAGMGNHGWLWLRGNGVLSRRIAWLRQSAIGWSLAAALLTAAGLKTFLLMRDAFPFNADEAVVALMARHILQGGRPLFFYGQAYMGSLDAYLVAAGFALFGSHVWVIRLVQTILYVFTIATTVWLAKLLFDNNQIGTLAAWLLAIPTVNVTLYTTVSLGGYGEALLLGNLTLIIGLLIERRITDGQKTLPLLGLAWGFLAGLGLWAFGLTLVFTIPSALGVAWIAIGCVRQNCDWVWIRQKLGVIGCTALVGFLVGSAPWFYYAIRQGLSAPLFELGGSAIAGVEGLTWLAQIWQHFLNLLLLGTPVILGLRPPWGIEWLGLPLAPFVLALWIAFGAYYIRRRHLLSHSPYRLLLGVVLATVLGFILTPFGADPSGRYFLPLAAPLALLASEAIWSAFRRLVAWAWIAPVILICYNLFGILQCASATNPGFTTQFAPGTRVDQSAMPALISFLRAHGATRGYTNYWVSYPLAFLSQEDLIFVPRLPYHLDFRYTARDDRYLPYTELVEQAEQVAYITTNHPDLDEMLQQRFADAGIAWHETQIGDFHVFYDLSAPLRPADIGFGVDTP